MNPRLTFDQFWGFAGSSVVYQSTRILPSAVFVGAIGRVLVRSRASSWSISRRSSVKFWVSVRLFVLVREAASRSSWLVFVVIRSIVTGLLELVRESWEVGFSLLFMAVLYVLGSSKPGFSSGYRKYLLRVAHRTICPMGASLIMSAMGETEG